MKFSDLRCSSIVFNKLLSFLKKDSTFKPMKKIIVLVLGILFTIISVAQMKTYNIHFGDEVQLTNASFRGADFAYSTALVSGSNGKVFKASSAHKPLSWQMLHLPDCDSLQFRDVAILNDKTFLLMAAGEGAHAQIWKSIDSGKHWNKVYQNLLPKAFFNGFDFWDSKRGILISDPIDEQVYLLETNDAGNTWQRLQSESLPILNGKEYGFAASGTGIQCFGEGNIAVGTGGEVARIFRSTDYGNSWSVENTPILQGSNSQGIFSVHFLNNQKAMAVGGDYASDELAGNNIIHLNAGDTWTNLAAAENIRFKSCVRYLNASLILVTGTSGTAITYNAGDSWEYLPDVKGYHTIAYNTSLKRGFMAGSEGRVLEFWVEG